jgi:hypothetical protein
MNSKSDSATPAVGFSVADLFDAAGRLRPFDDLPPSVVAQIASFDVVRVTTRLAGETVITEELIRVKMRDRRTAAITRRGGDSVSARAVRRKPIARGLVTSTERSAGEGCTAAANARRAATGDGEPC